MKRSVIQTIVMISLGCTKSTPVQPPPTRVHSLDVMGIVADTGARPVANAQISVSVLNPSLLVAVVKIGDCTGTLLIFSSPTVLSTDASGRFSTTLQWVPDGPTVCVSIQVTPAAGSNLAAAAQSKAGVRFKLPEEGRDTANFNVVLPRGP